MVEFALVFPIALLLFVAIVVIGMYVFYQQELTNVGRQAARFASIHSSTAACPTVSWQDPDAPTWNYTRFCDGPNTAGDPYPWPKMTAHARASAWAMDTGQVHINACWSGYVPPGSLPGTKADYPSVDAGGTPNQFMQCTLSGTDPTTSSGSLPVEVA